MIQVTNSVINTMPSGAADVTLAARNLSLSTTDGTTFPTLKYPLIDSVEVLPSLVEQVYLERITFAATNNQTYAFTLTQKLQDFPLNQGPGGALGKPLTARIQFISDATATLTEIGTALKAAVNAHTEFNLTAAYTPGDAFITVTATAGKGAALFTSSNLLNVTASAAVSMAGIGITATTDTDDVTVPTVCTSTAHGLVVGNVITLVVTNPNGNFVNGTYRVAPTTLTANTFTLTSLDGLTVISTTEANGTATVLKVAKNARGQGADLVTEGIVGATTGFIYKQYVFSG